MKKLLLVLAVALAALPVFAGEPTPVARQQQPGNRVLSQQGRAVQSTVTQTPSVERGKPTKDQREAPLSGPDTAGRQPQGVTPTPSVERGKPTKDQRSNSSDRVVPPTMTPTRTSGKNDSGRASEK